MNWDEMSPRERDALVAEKVMGWTDIETRQTSAWGKPDDFDASDPAVNVPEFTLDISAAWEVVKMMKSKHWNMDFINAYVMVDQTHQCLADFRNGNGCGRANSLNAPEAICLAALRAVGVEV